MDNAIKMVLFGNMAGNFTVFAVAGMAGIRAKAQEIVYRAKTLVERVYNYLEDKKKEENKE